MWWWLMKIENKKRVLIVIGIILYLIFGVYLTVTKLIPSHLQRASNKKYFEIYYQKAVEYVRTETDAIQLYGDDFELNKRSYRYSYSDEYRGLSDKEKTANSLQEFNQMMKEISVRVYVDRNDVCVVTFQKNDEGQFVVAGWKWDERY